MIPFATTPVSLPLLLNLGILGLTPNLSFKSTGRQSTGTYQLDIVILQFLPTGIG